MLEKPTRNIANIQILHEFNVWNWKFYDHILNDLEAFDPKWVNSILNIIEVNSLGLGGHQVIALNIGDQQALVNELDENAQPKRIHGIVS